MTFPTSLWKRSAEIEALRSSSIGSARLAAAAHQTRSSSRRSGAGLPRRYFYDTFRLHYAEDDANRIFPHSRHVTSTRAFYMTCMSGRKSRRSAIGLLLLSGGYTKSSFDLDNSHMRERLDETCCVFLFFFLKKRKYQSCMNQITLTEVKVARAALSARTSISKRIFFLFAICVVCWVC